jgi:hypothetical protein
LELYLKFVVCKILIYLGLAKRGSTVCDGCGCENKKIAAELQEESIKKKT